MTAAVFVHRMVRTAAALSRGAQVARVECAALNTLTGEQVSWTEHPETEGALK